MKSMPSFLQLKDMQNRVTEQSLVKIAADLIAIHTRFIEGVGNLDEIIKKKVGPKGDKPTIQELVAVIKPFVDDKLSDEQITRVLRPLVSNLKNDVTPAKEDILLMIKSLMPKSEEIVSLLKPHIPLAPKVKDGITPIKGVTYFTSKDKLEIAQIASRMVKIPLPKADKKEIDPMSILDAIQKLPSGRRIPSKYIDGLEQTMSALKNQTSRGYLHGAGITQLFAGANITLVRDRNGNYTISSTGGSSGTWYQDEILTRTGGTNYTLAHIPTSVLFLNLNGKLLVSGVGNDYTRSGAAIVLANPTFASDQLVATYL